MEVPKILKQGLFFRRRAGMLRINATTFQRVDNLRVDLSDREREQRSFETNIKVLTNHRTG